MTHPRSSLTPSQGLGNSATQGSGTLSPADVELLQQRYGLTIETIAAAGLRSLSRQEVSELVGFDPGSGGIGVPFPGWPGYWRVRLHEPCGDARGVPHRYLSPKGQPNRLYVPPNLAPQRLKGTELLIITKGEFKALRAAQDGLVCVGLVGVWGWKTRHPGGYDLTPSGVDELLPDFLELEIRRPIGLILDSDQPQGSPGYQAFTRLAGCLYRAGAQEVRIVVLPAAPDLDKTGLDDYLNASHSLEELMSLITRTPLLPPPGQAAIVPAFPLSALPAPLARWVREVAQAMGVPEDFVGVPFWRVSPQPLAARTYWRYALNSGWAPASTSLS